MPQYKEESLALKDDFAHVDNEWTKTITVRFSYHKTKLLEISPKVNVIIYLVELNKCHVKAWATIASLLFVLQNLITACISPSCVTTPKENDGIKSFHTTFPFYD